MNSGLNNFQIFFQFYFHKSHKNILGSFKFMNIRLKALFSFDILNRNQKTHLKKHSKNIAFQMIVTMNRCVKFDPQVIELQTVEKVFALKVCFWKLFFINAFLRRSCPGFSISLYYLSSEIIHILATTSIRLLCLTLRPNSFLLYCFFDLKLRVNLMLLKMKAQLKHAE